MQEAGYSVVTTGTDIKISLQAAIIPLLGIEIGRDKGLRIRDRAQGQGPLQMAPLLIASDPLYSRHRVSPSGTVPAVLISLPESTCEYQAPHISSCYLPFITQLPRVTDSTDRIERPFSMAHLGRVGIVLCTASFLQSRPAVSA